MRRRPVTFKKGDMVLLSTKNLSLKGEAPLVKLPRRKLMPRFVGPFAVVGEISDVAFRLHLPAGMKCHPVFHVNLLRAYNHGPWPICAPTTQP